jgi:hypothetical protein
MTDYLYIEALNLYMSPDGCTYTEEQVNHLCKLEEEWRKNLPRYSFTQLMEIYPNATREAHRAQKENIKQYKQKLREISEMESHYYDVVIAKAPFQEQEKLSESSAKQFDERRKIYVNKIKAATFNLLHLDQLDGKIEAKKSGGITDIDIARAKQVPIENFYNDTLSKRGKRASGKCPFHTETDSSFMIYLDQNSWYCYGACASGGSVVDYIMKQQGIDFISAVKFLLK